MNSISQDQLVSEINTLYGAITGTELVFRLDFHPTIPGNDALSKSLSMRSVEMHPKVKSRFNLDVTGLWSPVGDPSQRMDPYYLFKDGSSGTLTVSENKAVPDSGNPNYGTIHKKIVAKYQVTGIRDKDFEIERLPVTK